MTTLQFSGSGANRNGTSAAASHIPQFGDVYVSAGDLHLQWETTGSPEADATSPAGDAVSPTEDLLTSQNFGICDTTRIQ